MEVFEQSGQTHAAEAGTYRRALPKFETSIRQYEDMKEVLFLNPQVGDENHHNLTVITPTDSAYTDHRIIHPVVV